MKHPIFRQPLKHKAFGKFMSVVHESHMCYCASELQSFGLTESEIQSAVNRAKVACEEAGLQTRLHFYRKCVHRDDALCEDYKLSKLGYQLTLMNANPSNKLVAQFQLNLLAR